MVYITLKFKYINLSSPNSYIRCMNSSVLHTLPLIRLSSVPPGKGRAIPVLN
jgi:hypothetical protein